MTAERSRPSPRSVYGENPSHITQRKFSAYRNIIIHYITLLVNSLMYSFVVFFRFLRPCYGFFTIYGRFCVV